MRTMVTALLTGMLALSLSAATADAAGKKCKAGFEYDPKKQRCVPSEGS